MAAVRPVSRDPRAEWHEQWIRQLIKHWDEVPAPEAVKDEALLRHIDAILALEAAS